VLEEARLTTMLTSAGLPSSAAGRPQLDVGVIGALRDLHVDGLLVVGSVPDRARLAEVVGDLPVVVVGAWAEEASADVVRSDDAGMALVVDHLVERGHRRIAAPGGRQGFFAASEERRDGQVISQFGIGSTTKARAFGRQRGGREAQGAAAGTLRACHRRWLAS
jgi:DNA-binding LacI/PurR family transcriptional regulator